MIINMTGGGGAALNFKIVGGTSVPDSPKENTIWVNTETDITSWALAFDEPAEPVEGMAWITIGMSGYNVFNALRKNVLAVAPMAAKQYVDGAWESREGKIYIDGQWHDFVLWLVKDGATPYTITCIGKPYNASYAGAWSSGSVTPGDGYLAVGGDSGGYGIAYIADIDLTVFKTLTIEGTFVQEGVMVQLIVWSELGQYLTDNRVKYKELPSGEETVTLDVSGLTGVYTVGISSVAQYKQKIKNWYLS